MKKIILPLVCLLSCCYLINGQQSVDGSLSTTVYSFPDDWLGYWQGTLQIIGPEGVRQEIPMALDYRPEDGSDRYHWAIIYGEDTIAGRRDYYLQSVNDSLGHYRVDEQNGILLDGYHFADAFTSAFMVQGNYLTSVSRREGNEMIFEIYMMKHEHPSQTGGVVQDSTEIPIVYSYPVAVRQVARLRR